jgi:hypothetical protein
MGEVTSKYPQLTVKTNNRTMMEVDINLGWLGACSPKRVTTPPLIRHPELFFSSCHCRFILSTPLYIYVDSFNGKLMELEPFLSESSGTRAKL